MDELVVLDVVQNEAEAELLCSRLRNEGIKCAHRLTNLGAGAFDGSGVGGPREVIVRLPDLERARELVGRP